MVQIAHIENDFKEKFGIPRQSGLVSEVKARIIFEPEYRNADALRGLEDFSHLWIIWEFSEAKRKNGEESTEKQWRPTVRPPRLGGNTRLGVFATRSPFRPNPIGLSCVEIDRIENTQEYGPVIIVKGADLMNGTPIFDIKPYIPYADCRPDAKGGFTEATERKYLVPVVSDELAKRLSSEELSAICGILREDPRPAYQNDPERIYTFSYGRYEISFRCEDEKAILTDIRA